MEVIIPPDILGEDLVCANNDANRLSFLKTALTDPTTEIIWLLNGEYGLTRIIPGLLDFKKPEKEKLFIGFSDGTVLHVFLNQVWQWPSIHGQPPSIIAKQTIGSKTIKTSLQILSEGLITYAPLIHPFNDKATSFSELSGHLAGGNLCLLTCSLGTPWQLNVQGKIIFLEDVNEPGYRIDRMLVQLEQAKIFQKAKTILLGDFTKGYEKDGGTLIPEVLKRFAANNNLLVYRVNGCGHGNDNYPLHFNKKLTFTVKTDE